MRPPSAVALDGVHDLLLHLLGDAEEAASATADVAARAAARVRDGVLDGMDATVLLRCAHDHVLARATVDDDLDPRAVTDLTVLHLVVRQGLEPRDVARITGVRRRSVVARRTRAAEALATAEGTSAAAASRELASGDTVPAPDEVHRRVAPLLAGLPTPSGRRHRGALRIAVIVLVTVALLAAIAAATAFVIRPATLDPEVAVGEQVEYTPVPSTVVLEEDPAAVTDGEATLADDEGSTVGAGG